VKNILRKSARGQDCLVRIPGICNHNPETTILAHRNGAGMGRKHNDLFGAFCCSDCHSFVDGGWTRTDYTLTEVLRYHFEGIFRTQQWWIDNNMIGELK